MKEANQGPRVIVSLTSYPKRIDTVHQVLEHLKQQSKSPDFIVLYLAKSQFPALEQSLPQTLLDCFDEQTLLRWCDSDFKPHKKYFYALQDYPEDCIITVDDDILYEHHVVEELYASYEAFPFAVSCGRAHRMVFDETGQVAPYERWEKEYKVKGYPSLQLCAIGCSGILYPPHCLHPEVLNQNFILEHTLHADDLWLKCMEVLALTPVVIACDWNKVCTIDGTQEDSLFHHNVDNKANDRQLENILREYNHFHGKEDSLLRRMNCNLQDKDTILQSITQQYYFPWEKVAVNSNIVIYGAGLVGQSYLTQLQLTNYGTVVALCDQNAKTLPRQSVSLITMEELEYISFDVIVIAIENKEVVKKVRQNLIHLGILEGKIR